MTYDFGDQLEIGEKAEGDVDRFFSKRNHIAKATKEEQLKYGIDRVFIRGDGQRSSVEIKSDLTASKSGNVFIETLSASDSKKPGWVYTSTAQYLLYYLPLAGIAYVCEMLRVREMIGRWKKVYSKKSVRTNGKRNYTTTGIIVPIAAFIEDCNAKEYSIKRHGKGAG